MSKVLSSSSLSCLSFQIFRSFSFTSLVYRTSELFCWVYFNIPPIVIFYLLIYLQYFYFEPRALYLLVITNILTNIDLYSQLFGGGQTEPHVVVTGFEPLIFLPPSPMC